MSAPNLTELPHHVAIIMDGNGRWAERQGRPRQKGHEQGATAVRNVVRASRKIGIRALTLYAFSEQNWDRPRDEVAALMELLRQFLISERLEILDNGIRLQAIGRTSRLPGPVQSVLEALVRETEKNEGMLLSLALSYGGREEIADAARALSERVAQGELAPSDICEARLEAEMASMRGGPVDLLIRTGGEQRISNFVLWGAAYAELYFSPVLWPEFSEANLYEAIAAYQQRERRFGRVTSELDARGVSPVLESEGRHAHA